MKKIITLIKKSVSNEKERKKVQFTIIYVIIGTIAAIMGILNLTHNKMDLTIVSFLFAFFNYLNVVIILKFKSGFILSAVLFVTQIVLLFTYLLIKGGIDGFSVIWVLLLPSCGLLLLGAKLGTIVSAVILSIMLLFFCVPTLNSQLSFHYSNSFMIRFPIVFIATYLISLFLESYRSLTYKELKKTQKKFEILYTHDALTGARNRYGFEDCVSQLLNLHETSKIGVLMIDIDHFKNFNDTYGHNNGDVVLKTIVKTIKDNMNDKQNVYRWGGEEFVVMFFDGENAYKYATDIQAAIKTTPVILENGNKVSITSSMGLIISEKVKSPIEIQSLIKKADELLYKAKNNGRDRIEYYEI